MAFFEFLQVFVATVIIYDKADGVLFRKRLAEGFVFVAEPSNLFKLAEKIELFASGDDGGVIDGRPTRGRQELEFVQKIRAPFGGCGVSCNIIRQRKMPYEKAAKPPFEGEKFLTGQQGRAREAETAVKREMDVIECPWRLSL